jgi:drug/metabolite transporter (DMT)-like permease
VSGRGLINTAHGTSREAFGLQEWALLLVVAAIWGSSFVLVEVALDHFEPGLVAFGRVAIGTLAVSAFPRSRRRVERSDVPRIAVLGLLWMGAPLLLFAIGQQHIDSSLAGMLNGAVPVFATVIAALLLRRSPGPRQIVGVAVGFVGVVAILWPATRGADATAFGASLVVLAVLCYAVALNIAVPLQQRYGALPVLLRAQIVALVTLSPAALIAFPASTFAWSSALALSALGIFGTGLAFVAMSTLVGRVGATRGSVAIYLLPIVAIVLGVVFLDESVEPMSIAGTALVLFGAYLTSRSEVRGPATAAGVEAYRRS